MKRILLPLLLIYGSFQSNAQIVINEYCCSNLNKFPDNYGEYEDYIELYNTGSNTVTLSGYYLSDNPALPTKWMIPPGVTINPNGFKKIWCSGRNELTAGNLHSSFRLTQTKIPAETICIADPSGTIIDQQVIEITQLNHSRGRATDGSATWSVFTNPTPGNSNNTATAYSGYALKPTVDIPAGFYTSPINVTVSSTEPGVTIRYTLDGNEPVSSSAAYSGPIGISTTKILKARAFSSDPDILPGLIEFDTYFINEVHTVPVVSIAANQLKNL